MITTVILAAAAVATNVQAEAAAPAHARFERWATISKMKNGYYYDAGQQDTKLVITKVPGGVRYADAHTDVIRSKPDSCQSKPARAGSVVVCKVPKSVNARHPMTLKIFTRLGNDYIDSTALPASFELYMLADAGNDTVKAGAGDDFINGADGVDHMRGGRGNDWIRTGLKDDHIWGGPGRDRLVGVQGRDRIFGGRGNDRVGGGPGNDRLVAGDGTDFVLCSTGMDHVVVQRVDRIMQDCESVSYR